MCFVAAGEVVLSLVQMYEANYPEILKNCYIINGKLVILFLFSYFLCYIFIINKCRLDDNVL